MESILTKYRSEYTTKYSTLQINIKLQEKYIIDKQDKIGNIYAEYLYKIAVLHSRNWNLFNEIENLDHFILKSITYDTASQYFLKNGKVNNFFDCVLEFIQKSNIKLRSIGQACNHLG